MRFEELSYRVDGAPVAVPFHPRLTVVGPLGGRARSGWIDRALGVLLGTRPGDGVGVVFRDGAGHRVRIERDHHGAARITGVGTGDDVTPAAGRLPLDGRFDWFETIGLDGPSARALVHVVPSDFKGEDVDPWETEDELVEARGLLTRIEAEHETVLARCRQAEELYRRVDQLDEHIIRLEADRARRRHGEALQAVRRLEAKAAILRQAVASEQAAAEAILAAAEAGNEWRRAADSLEVARLAFGDRPLPETAATTEPAASPPPATASLGDGDGPGDTGMVAELEAAHRAVEEAERALDRVRMPSLAVASRRRLVRAHHQEQAVLREMGFVSWLSFQMQRVDDLQNRPREAVSDVGDEAPRSAPEPDAGAVDRAREGRLRHTLEEAEATYQVARERLETLMAYAGLLPRGSHPEDLAAHVGDLALRAVEAARHRRTPPTGGLLAELEGKLSEARAAHAALGHPDWDDDPRVGDTPLPEPAPLLEERARLFEEAHRIELELPDVGRLEGRRTALEGRIAFLEAASRTGYHLQSVEEAESVLIDRVAHVFRVGPAAEPLPLLVDDAFAGFDIEDRHDLLHLLARLAEGTQVVYFTEDPLTLEWAAAQVQAGEALVVPPPSPPPAVASVA